MAGITRGGAEIWDLKMAEGLEGRGADVTFYLGKPLSSELPEPVEGFETVEIPTPHLQDCAYAAPPGIGGTLATIDSAVFCRKVAQEVQRRDHDLVQISGRPGFAWYVDSINALVSIVMHGEPYSFWYDVVKPWGSIYELFKDFDQVLAVGGASEAIEARTSCSVTTINPGVETDVFTPGDGDSGDSKRILFVGRFVPVKNLEVLIEAFDVISDDHPEAELVLVGDGPERGMMKNEVNSRGLHDRVRFTGYVSNEDLPDLYRSATVFVLSSKSEAYPITILEAMSCGTPVVAPRVGGIADIIDDGENGSLYSTGVLEELAAEIDTLLSDVKYCRSCSKSAREKALESFDWSDRQTKLHQSYSRIL